MKAFFSCWNGEGSWSVDACGYIYRYASGHGSNTEPSFGLINGGWGFECWILGNLIRMVLVSISRWFYDISFRR